MLNYKSRTGKILQRIQELGECSESENGVTRAYGGEQHVACANKIAAWMKEAGLEVRIDTIGNVRGRYTSKAVGARTFVMGSHYDSMPESGYFDGILGVTCAIDIAANIIKQKTELPFHLEIIAFCEYEGLRFHTPLLGSKVLAGRLKSSMLERKDDKGETLEEFLVSQNKDVKHIKGERILPENFLGYYEIQPENGPILFKQDLPVSVVNAIAGRKLIEIIFEGKQGHAGNIPMEYRKDALCAAAEFIVEAEDYAQPSRRNSLVTVGKIQVKNGATNKIPAKVHCTLDIRSSDPVRLAKTYEALNKLCERVCHRRGIYFEWRFLHETDPVRCDENMRMQLGRAIRRHKVDLLDMTSGTANHASVISAVAPVVMLFVRSSKGSNFDTDEKVKPEDISMALKVSDTFIQTMTAETAVKESI